MNNIIFETTRLTVCQYSMQDIDYFFLLNSNAETMRYIRPVRTMDECTKILQKNIEYYEAHPQLGGWAAFEKETKNYIGSLAIFPIGETDRIQIGYSFLPPYWSKGYATELVKVGIPFFFENNKDEILYAVTETPNTASRNVLIKCGFQQESLMMENEIELVKFCITRKAYHELQR